MTETAPRREMAIVWSLLCLASAATWVALLAV
jgi:hypothetical protein